MMEVPNFAFSDTPKIERKTKLPELQSHNIDDMHLTITEAKFTAISVSA